VCVCACVQDMLSPKVVRPLSNHDKVLLQCEQTRPMHFDELLSDRCVSHSLIIMKLLSVT